MINYIRTTIPTSCIFFILLTIPLSSHAIVKLGIDVLEESKFQCLKGKRVGLLTHPAGVNAKGTSTIDVLWKSPFVNLTTLYGPEHGIFGDEKADIKVADRIHPKMQIPIYSLYGEHRRPSPEMLQNVDVIVIDLQDIGVRSYTFASCMCYTLEECFKNNIEVVVLDRPNPLSGLKVDGPIMDKKWISYVGALPVPYVHGLTLGELAKICKSEPDWLAIPDEIRKKGKLTVIPMQGWKRSMFWPQTNLKWIATSPNIKTFSAALGYPMTGLGCITGGFTHGYGTQYPFQLLSSSKQELSTLKTALQKRKISGITFHKQSATNTIKKEKQKGLYISITDYNAWKPTELSFHLMQLSCLWNPENPFTNLSESQQSLFNKHVGSEEWYTAITQKGSHVDLQYFLTKWEKDSKKFQAWSQQYWLYK